MHDPTSLRPPARRVAVNTVLRALAETLGKLAGLLLLVYIARALTPSTLGDWVFAMAVVGLVASPLGSGIDRLALRDIARHKGSVDRLFADLAALKLVTAGAGFAIVVVAVAALGYSGHVVALVAMFAGAGLISLLAQSFQTVFQAFERGEYYFYAVTPNKILNSMLGIVMVALGAGIAGVALAYAVAAAISVAIGAVLMYRHFARPRYRGHRRDWRALLRAMVPFSAQEALAQVVIRSNIVLLSLLTTSAVVGYFGSAYRLVEATLFFAWSVGTSVTPMYSYLEWGDRGAAQVGQPSLRGVYEGSLKFVTAIMVPIGVVAFVCARPIIDLAYGLPEYASAVPLLRWLAFVTVVYSLGHLAGILVLVRRPARVTLIASGVVAVVNIALNLALIPPFGAEGAAAATLATEVLLAGIVIVLARPVGGRPRWWWTLSGPFAAGAAMALAMLPLSDRLYLALPAGVVTYLVLLLLFEWRRLGGDVETIRTVLGRGPRPSAAGTG